MKINALSTLLIMLIFSLSQLNAQNQNNDEEGILKQLTPTERLALNALSQQDQQVYLSQTGWDNTTNINQVTTDPSHPNHISVIQNGDLNSSTINQEGAGNINKTTQNGSNNDYSLSLYGDDIKTTVEQNGDNNQISQNLSGSELEYILIQNGNNHQIIQTENSSQTTQPAYSIMQSGNGMRLEISQGNIYR